MSVGQQSTIDREGSTVSVSPRSHGQAGKCSVCSKELSWYNRKRKCSICKLTACRDCTSKGRSSGEILCQSCVNSGLNFDDPTDQRLTDIGSRSSPAISQDVPIPKGYLGVLRVHVIEARGLIAADKNILGQRTSSDPYCVLSLSGESTTVTGRVVSNTLNPVWDELLSLQVRVPVQNVLLDVYDKDVAGSDVLGHVSIPLERLPNGKVQAGWIPLTSPNQAEADLASLEPPSTDQAGAIRIAVRFDYLSGRELRGFIRAGIAAPSKSSPRFDVNALYSPSMLIQELLWNRTLQPCMEALLYLLSWESFVLSSLAMITWIYLARFVAYWPSAVLFILAGAVFHNTVKRYFKNLVTQPEQAQEQKFKLLNNLARMPFKAVQSLAGSVASVGRSSPRKAKRTTPSPTALGDETTTEYEEQSLGMVIRKVTLVTPGWLKDQLAEYQPILRTVSENVAFGYDILFGNYDKNLVLVILLCSTGFVLLYVPFSLLVAASGGLLFFSMSPLMGLFMGLLQYLSKPKRWTDPVMFGFRDSFDAQWISTDAINGKRKSRGPKFGAST